MEPKKRIEILAVYLKSLRRSELWKTDKLLREAIFALAEELSRLCFLHKESIMQEYGFSDEDYNNWQQDLIRKD